MYRDYNQLKKTLSRALDTGPVLDGQTHPAEVCFIYAHRRGTLAKTQPGQYDRLLSHLFWWTTAWATSRPSWSVSMVRCLARQQVGTPAWQTRLVQWALSQADVELRDAAVCACEEWSSEEVWQILRAHREQEKWLQDHITQLLADRLEPESA